MVEIDFDVNEQHCECSAEWRDKHIIANSKQQYKANFTFDDEWEGIAKTVRFLNQPEDGESSFEDVTLDNDHECYIPDTVLKPGLLMVGVFGGDMLPTDMGYVRVRESIISGTTPEPPKPDVYQQLLQMISQANTTATLALNNSYEAIIKSGSYIFNQQTDSALWVIEHNLDKRPVVSAFDTDRNTIIGIVTYVDSNVVTIGFSEPIKGTAVLN